MTARRAPVATGAGNQTASPFAGRFAAHAPGRGAGRGFPPRPHFSSAQGGCDA